MRCAAWVSRLSALVLTSSLAVVPLTAQLEFRQTQTDSYTRYELLDPTTQSFRIIYDVSATTAGAPYYFNGIRRGSDPTVHDVYDLMTGVSLPWEIVDGPTARRRGMENAAANGQYIQVSLARPVPKWGQARIRIDKTYRDTLSYTAVSGEILFDRTLGITRNSIVLPVGYELIGVNYPSQVVRESDGRVKVSFMNRGSAGVPLTVRGRQLVRQENLPAMSASDRPTSQRTTVSTDVPAGARTDYEFTERAFEDRDIVYFLQQPETHSFRLYHDYTESRAGVDRYINVVRAGSRATNPSAKILDTGEELTVETLRGNAITERGIELNQDVTPDTEIVAIWFDAVPDGQSVRLRIEETYTDPNRYVLAGDELVWDRSFGRPRNTVILPDGWLLTANSVPAVIDLTDDGRVRLRYVNDRPGGIDVFVKAQRR